MNIYSDSSIPIECMPCPVKESCPLGYNWNVCIWKEFYKRVGLWGEEKSLRKRFER